MPRTKPRLLKSPASPNPASNGIAETSEVLTLEEAASYLRVPTDVILPMIEADGLPARQFGADWRFYKVALQAWLGAAPAKRGILNHIGRIKEDPYADKMLREIYARRRRPETGEE